MPSSWIPRWRELVFLASGFCLALLLVLTWRYVVSRPPSPSSAENAMNTSGSASPTPPPISSQSGRPSETTPPFQAAPATRATRELRYGIERNGEPRSERARPAGLERAAPSESPNVHESHTPPVENDHEALKSFLQDSLQRKIDEDGNLRAILLEAAKAHLQKREGGEP